MSDRTIDTRGQSKVFAYGILLVPKDIKAGEKRPVVVCQHGVEGRASDVADPNRDTSTYHRFGAKLAEEAGAVDVLVSNAGIPASGRLANRSVEEIDRAIAVNLRAGMILAHALAPATPRLCGYDGQGLAAAFSAKQYVYLAGCPRVEDESVRASVLTKRVFASPGTPTSTQWPRAKIAVNSSSIT